MARRRTENLFRRNAVRSLNERRHGRPIARLPRAWLWLAGFAAAFCGVLFVFAATIDYARKESARGWLVAEKGIVRIAHGGPAVIASVLRRAGDAVSRGDVIAYLSPAEASGDGGKTASTIHGLLRDELDEVATRESLAREQFAADLDALTAQISGVDRELLALADQRRGQRARVSRSRETLSRLESAHESGAIAEVDLLRQRDEFATQQQSLARLAQEQDRLGRERGNLQARRERLASELEAQLSELASLGNEIRLRLARHESDQLVPVASPIDGTIATLDLVAGNTIRPGQLLATVMPEHSSLVADVYVPTRAVGMIRPGQPVRLRYDAFPPERFGVATGVVDSVDDFVLLPEDVPSSFRVGEATYRVRVRLDAPHVVDRRGRHALKPGMLLVADVVLESRSILEWLSARVRLSL